MSSLRLFITSSYLDITDVASHWKHFIQVVEDEVEHSSAIASVLSLDDGLELDSHWGGLETLGQISLFFIVAMMLLIIGLSSSTALSNPSVIKRKSRKNSSTPKQAVWKVLVLVCCCLVVPFGTADPNKVRNHREVCFL